MTLVIAANYYKFLVNIFKKFRNYKNTNCEIRIFPANLLSIWVKSRIMIVKIRISTHTEYFCMCSHVL